MTKIKIFMDGDMDNLMEDVNSFLKKIHKSKHLELVNIKMTESRTNTTILVIYKKKK